MSASLDMTGPRVSAVERASVTDRALLEVLELADRVSTPRPEWYLVLGHAPEMAVGYANFWNLTYRGGRVEHATKELMRVAITTLLSCSFCSTQRSVDARADGLEEDRIEVCALPNFTDPDPRVHAALQLARALASDTSGEASDWDEIYAEVHAHFDDAELAELICFCANTLGGAIVTRTLNLLPER
jgi:alkylhydroperoxidase family enzyme